jgi:putative PIN family toxin of toxin-antitoxin system
LATQGDFGLVLAPEIIGETWRKLLTSDRIRKRYGYSDERVHRYCRGLLRICELVRGLPPIAAVARDPNDDMIIACAVKGQAEAIITRDKDLLSLNSYQRIAIITPETFREQLRQTG